MRFCHSIVCLSCALVSMFSRSKINWGKRMSTTCVKKMFTHVLWAWLKIRKTHSFISLCVCVCAHVRKVAATQAFDLESVFIHCSYLPLLILNTYEHFVCQYIWTLRGRFLCVVVPFFLFLFWMPAINTWFWIIRYRSRILFLYAVHLIYSRFMKQILMIAFEGGDGNDNHWELFTYGKTFELAMKKNHPATDGAAATTTAGRMEEGISFASRAFVFLRCVVFNASSPCLLYPSYSAHWLRSPMQEECKFGYCCSDSLIYRLIHLCAHTLLGEFPIHVRSPHCFIMNVCQR